MEYANHKIKHNDQRQIDEIDPVNIIFCKADGSYTRIFFSGGRNHTVCQNLKNVTEILPAAIFHRCHHSFTINLDKITGFDISRSELLLLEEYIIPVSRRRLKGFICKLKIKSKHKNI